MSKTGTGESVDSSCTNLRQGDVVGLLQLQIPGENGTWENVETPAGVAVLSQTCDLVQRSKTRCLVAPVVNDATDAALSCARKGRKPLHLYLESAVAEPRCCIADMECAVSIPKAMLLGAPLIARYVKQPSGRDARVVASRIGRAFSRFPFPDEVYPVFGKLRSEAQKKSGSLGHFGQVLNLVEDLRVSADQWMAKNRHLTLYIVVSEEWLIPTDDMDPNWHWDTSRVIGLHSNEPRDGLVLDRVCELILANLKYDKTSLASLWELFGETIRDTLLAPNLNSEVVSFDVYVLSCTEMTYRQFQTTESLDLEVLSDSTKSAKEGG